MPWEASQVTHLPPRLSGTNMHEHDITREKETEATDKLETAQAGREGGVVARTPQFGQSREIGESRSLRASTDAKIAPD